MQLGVLVEHEVARASDDGREAADTAALPWALRREQVQNLAGWHQPAAATAYALLVAGVLVVEPIALHAADGVVLHAIDDDAALAALADRALAVAVKPVDLKQLDLQRYAQAIAGAARAAADQHLAVDLHRAVSGGLEAVEIVNAIGIGAF